MALYLSILSVLLLSVVAGLLLAVWMQLREWKDSTREAPLLAEKMAEQLMNARRGLEELKRALVASGPEISALVSDAGKARVELQFLLQRAEQVAATLDAPKAKVEEEGTATVALPDETPVERVAGANGLAAQQSQVAHDPLEDLLATLQAGEEAGNVTLLHRPGRASKRKGPVTQAELDLQQKVAG